MSGSYRLMLGGLVAALLAAGCTSDRSQASHFEKTRFVRSAIQDGMPDHRDTGVAGINLVTASGRIFASCTGSLIAPNLVLTARHCVSLAGEETVDCTKDRFGKTEPPRRFRVHFDQRFDPRRTKQYQVAEVLVESSGNFVCGNDIALLILKRNIPLSVAQPIAPVVGRRVFIDESYAAAGYGDTCGTCSDGGMARNRKDGLSVLCIGPTCHAPPDAIVDSEWYGGDAICQGDSGGPALSADGRQIGVAVRGGVKGDRCVGSVYERLDAHRDFLVSGAKRASRIGRYRLPKWASSGTEPLPVTCGDCSQWNSIEGRACFKEWELCGQDCFDFNDCLNGCTTLDCRDKCYRDYPNAAVLFRNYWNCICDRACETECRASCQKPPCGLSFDGSCGTCLKNNCCAEGERCGHNGPCEELAYCAAACGRDDACVKRCERAYRPGRADYMVYRACAEKACANECPWLGGGTGGNGGAGGGSGAGGAGGGSGAGASAGSSGQGGASGGTGASAGVGGAAGLAGGSGMAGSGNGAGPAGATAAGGDSGASGTSPHRKISPQEYDSGCSCGPSGRTPLPSRSRKTWEALLLVPFFLVRRKRGRCTGR